MPSGPQPSRSVVTGQTESERGELNMASAEPLIMIRSFGAFSISVAGHQLPLPKGLSGNDVTMRPAIRSLIAFLAEKRGPRSRAEICRALWPDDPKGRGKRGLALLVREARRLAGEIPLGYTLIDSSTQGYGLNPDLGIQSDFWVVKGLIDALQAQATAVSDLPILAQGLVETASEPYLDDLGRFEWVRESKQAVGEAISAALLRARDRVQAAGKNGSLIPTFKGWPTERPEKTKGERPLKSRGRSRTKEVPADARLPADAQLPTPPKPIAQEIRPKVIRLFAPGSYGRAGSRIFDVRLADAPSAHVFEVLAVNPVEAAMAAACRILKARPARKVSLWVRGQDGEQASRVNLQACLKPVDIQPWEEPEATTYTLEAR
jgi:DNA-binding SARP family transcriptional activator